MRVLPCGDRAALVELDTLAEVLGMTEALRADPPTGATDIVPAARTVLVRFDPARTSPDRLAAELAGRERRPATRPGCHTVEIPVRYDGDDLADVARLTGLTPREVAERHQAARYVVAFAGFAPGFAYISGGDPALRVSRRDSPRTAVPAGAVAIADEYSAVYPRESPGGWRIIGRTDLPVWTPDRERPMLLPPGTGVRFVEVRS
ncbi:allophanate hydrolase subunit 1 [Haloechinothrix sp. LS1_15]|uniref:5-oxoprolinase subunit B family protein n=1 Tax=Haloechinothrix sp. LS1_15 TaxID=2652248 RepID=UPI002947498F|nr:allophanate hydrolase subunit 1 [Haloechinothrix sp. LS1_15]MDV6013962.1 allophanate hydrolase subunit 1 [Haloechinothrix sp. LS1_15]